jgi:RsiW-degrading membrane proteinase PrsW (M82 family)
MTPHYQPISYAILIASVVPLVFLYLVNWLNFFETHRARSIFVALAWGAISLGLAYSVDHPIRLILGMPFVGTHFAPPVEEVFKSLVLLYLVRRGATTSFVDGAVYGFAAGIGFAIAENMLFLSRVDIDTGVIVGTLRAFASSVLHGSTSAIVGMAVAGFPLGRLRRHLLLAWLVGLAVAISIHTTYNTIAFHEFVHEKESFVALTITAFIALSIATGGMLWGLRLERRQLRRSLGTKSGVSKGEAMLVQRIEDLDDVLAPIEQRYGEVKREQVANALLLAAQLAMKQEQIRRARDPELLVEIAPQITELKRELKQARSDVGIYVMSQVRSIVPKTKWSIWARVGQITAKLGPPNTNLWGVLRDRLLGHNAGGEGLYHRVQVGLAARQGAAALAVEGEEE